MNTRHIAKEAKKNPQKNQANKKIKQNKGIDYDQDGLWSRSGRVDSVLLDSMLADGYFQKKHPKSTGPG
jgi:anhydro-N-acetylmuramic acid kinase